MAEELTTAAKIGDFEGVKRSIEKKGVDVDSRFPKSEGPTALYWASCNGFAKIGAYLVTKGADPNIVLPKSGSTPLHAASDRGHYNCVLLLLSSGSLINHQTTNNDDTSLHLAAYRGHSAICSLLLNRRADITITNKQGRTPLDEAYIQGHNQVIGMLSLRHLELYRSLKVESPAIELVSMSQDFEDRIGIHPFSPEYSIDYKKNKKNKSSNNNESIFSYNFAPPPATPHHQSHFTTTPHFIAHPFQTPTDAAFKKASLKKCTCAGNDDNDERKNKNNDNDKEDDNDNRNKNNNNRNKNNNNRNKSKTNKNGDDINPNFQDKFKFYSSESINVKNEDDEEDDDYHKQLFGETSYEIDNSTTSATATTKQFTKTPTTTLTTPATTTPTTTTPTTSISSTTTQLNTLTAGANPNETISESRERLLERIEDLERLVYDLTDAIESKDANITALKEDNSALQKELGYKNYEGKYKFE